MAFNALINGGRSKKPKQSAPNSPVYQRSKSFDPSANVYGDEYGFDHGRDGLAYMNNYAEDLDTIRPMIKSEFVGEALCNILPVVVPSGSFPRSTQFVNECLLAVEVSSFQVVASSNVNFSLNRSHNSDNLLHHYVCVVRSTNRPFTNTTRDMTDQTDSNASDEPKIALDHPNDSIIAYDDMYASDYAGNVGDLIASTKQTSVSTTEDKNEHMTARKRSAKNNAKDMDETEPAATFHSHPQIVLLTQHLNGRTPEVRLVVGMDRMMTLENIVDSNQNVIMDHSTGNTVKMVFDSGDIVLIDFFTSLADAGRGSETHATEQESATVSKERFLWAILQLHALLCSTLSQSTQLEGSKTFTPLIIRNIDRNELQFYGTVHEFLKSIPSLWQILQNGDLFHDRKGPTASTFMPNFDEVEGLAYDLMMGGYMTRVQLFENLNERQYATDVLNALLSKLTSLGGEQKVNEDHDDVIELLNNANYEQISLLLHKQTRELEAEMCRRLIAWEDEKYSSLTLTGLGNLPPVSVSSGKDSISLLSLLQVLDKLDLELKDMELWLEDKAKTLKPTFDDCKDIEQGNKRLEMQSQSYELLQNEIRKHLETLNFPRQVENVLKNPSSQLSKSMDGQINIIQDKDSIDALFHAGQALKEKFDKIQRDGGVHLRAVNERARSLTSLSNAFCSELFHILEELIDGNSFSILMDSNRELDPNASHSFLAKVIRDTQRKFQNSVLNYIQLIEIVAMLRASVLPKIRKKYEQSVLSGNLSKERMATYRSSLPSKSSTALFNFGLREFTAIGLAPGYVIDPGTANLITVPAQDIIIVLNELLPLMAREAIFTASLFGLSSKEKNFDAVKKSVDYSTTELTAVISGVCGLPPPDSESKRRGMPHLCLVASLYLQEVMEGYQNKEKKGGDHSLSLAYVRSAILDIRKKADVVWVSWVEDQIKWIRTHPGVPLDGKQAGIFSSFSRFPSYLDYIISCCKAGKSDDSSPKLSKNKVITYYLQKMAGALFSSLQDCANRETTDKQYASHVMRIENSHFFIHSLKQRDPIFSEILKNQITSAHAICKQSIDSYFGWMIKQDMKPLHSLFSNISRVRKEVGEVDVQMHIPRQTFEKIFNEQASYDVLKEKIATMYRVMNKHFSTAGGLVPILWKAFGKLLFEWFGRWEKISTKCYKLVLQPSSIDVVKMTKLIAGTDATKKSGSTNKNVLSK